MKKSKTSMGQRLKKVKLSFSCWCWRVWLELHHFNGLRSYGNMGSTWSTVLGAMVFFVLFILQINFFGTDSTDDTRSISVVIMEMKGQILSILGICAVLAGVVYVYKSWVMSQLALHGKDKGAFEAWLEDQPPAVKIYALTNSSAQDWERLKKFSKTVASYDELQALKQKEELNQATPLIFKSKPINRL